MWMLGLVSLAMGQETRAELEAAGTAAVEPFAQSEHPPVVLTGATVWTVSGEVFSPGWVRMVDGTIDGVGEGTPKLDGFHHIDVSGKHITPGIIDTHSHLGVYPSPSARAHSDGNEATAPTTPGVWAEHSVWPQDPGFELALAGGITALQILPGSANLVGGRGVVMQNVPSRGSRGMRFPGAPETVKMACGENPKRVYQSRGPSTRMGNLRAFRQTFIDGQKYLREWEEYEGKLSKADDEPEKKRKKGEESSKKEPPKPPGRDLDKDTVAKVLDGSILVQVHCYRADDMLSVLQVAEEFGFEVRSFHHAVEAYKIRDVLAELDVSVSTWADWGYFKLEAFDAIPESPAMVHDAGAKAIIHSDSSRGIQRLNQEASKAYHKGLASGIKLTPSDALRWITWNPAWALGIHDQVGSIEAGKRADLVVWDGDPLSAYSSAELVFVEGLLRYDRSRPERHSDYWLGQGVKP